MAENEQKKSAGEQLSEKLTYKKKSAFELYGAEELRAAQEYCCGYKTFLDAAKTEREAVSEGIAMLEKCGFTPYELGDGLKPGDKRYLKAKVSVTSRPIITAESASISGPPFPLLSTAS